MKIVEVTDETIDEGIKSTLGNLGIAAAIAAGGVGGLTAKKGIEDYLNSKKDQPAQIVQPVAEPEKEVEPEAEPAAEPEKKPEVKTVTGSPHESFIKSFARKAGINGTELAAFLAQVSHETGKFRSMIETGSKDYFTRYDPAHSPKTAKMLGNVKVGDGERYKGRGYIQLTGRYNYRIAGKALGLPLEQNPELAEDPEIAAKIALWYWKSRVQPRVDDFNDVKAVTKPINPGLKGLKDRLEQFKEFKTVVSQSTETN